MLPCQNEGGIGSTAMKRGPRLGLREGKPQQEEELDEAVQGDPAAQKVIAY